MKVGPGAVVAALVVGLSFAATGGAARDATPSFPAPDCPAQLRPGATLSPSLLSDATHTVKRYSGGSDTRGGEIQCSYFDPAKNSNYSWDLSYLFKTDTAAQVASALAEGIATPLGGWANPLPAYCGVSKTAYAYVDCNSTDPDTVAAAKAMLGEAESLAAPQASAAKPPPTTTTPSPTRTATVGRINGAVEFSTDGGKTFAPLTASTVLKDGDFVATGYQESVVLTFGHGTLTVGQLTQFHIDKFVDANNIERTQLYLRVGAMKVFERHTDSIRSDFAVRSPICNSSIRGSEMIVLVAKNGATTTYTTSDVAYVKGSADRKAIAVRKGYMTTVGANKKATKPKRYTAAALKKITG